jgi:hypothetical protein
MTIEDAGVVDLAVIVLTLIVLVAAEIENFARMQQRSMHSKDLRVRRQ